MTASNTFRDAGDVGADPHPRLAGRRVTDLSTGLGGSVWLALTALAAGDALDLTVVELFVGLAVLVFVPLGLGLAATPHPTDGTSHLYRFAVTGQFPAALSVVVGLAFPVGSVVSVALVLPWLGVTGAVALFGLRRLLSRGASPVPELAVDAALLYVPVAAVALGLHRAEIHFHFRPVIVLLTAVHYHYAGFVLPLVTGRAGRLLTDDAGRFGTGIAGRLGLAATLVIIVNIGLIAVGITFSPLVEVVAVALFTVSVATFAALVLRDIVPAVARTPAALLTVASFALFLTMALALAYGYSAFPATERLLGIGAMIRWHGSLNAFAFALPALLAFRLLDR